MTKRPTSGITKHVGLFGHLHASRFPWLFSFNQCRPKLVKILQEKFAHLNLTYSIGGQISFDVFPQVGSCLT